jgi:hypothetical protein
VVRIVAFLQSGTPSRATTAIPPPQIPSVGALRVHGRGESIIIPSYNEAASYKVAKQLIFFFHQRRGTSAVVCTGESQLQTGRDKVVVLYLCTVCMYVCTVHTYIRTYIHTYFIHTCLHSGSGGCGRGVGKVCTEYVPDACTSCSAHHHSGWQENVENIATLELVLGVLRTLVQPHS